jgi:hypothetical protein
MDVSAIFELPVHIWVMCDALAAKYSTGYGELRFSVVLPTDQPPLGGAPDVPGTASRAELTGDQVVWAQEYGAFTLTTGKRLTADGATGSGYADRPPLPRPQAQARGFHLRRPCPG